MSFKKLIYIIIGAVLCFTVADFSFAEPAAASTSQAAKSKKKSGSKAKKSKKSKSRSGKKSSSKKRSSSKGKKKTSSRYKKSSKYNKNRKRSSSKRRGNVASSRYTAPPKETAQNDSLTLAVNKYIISQIPENLNPGGLRVNSVRPNPSTKTASVSLNENFTYLPVTHGFIDTLRRNVQHALPDSISNFKVTLSVDDKPLAYYIRRIDKLPEQYRKNPAFVTELHPIAKTSKGMENDIVALWHSHGRYYKNGGWSWQRPLLWQTIEDIFPMGYILPYVVPMLENAGAYVFLPRERDTNRNEVIVDNDTNPEGQVYSQSTYRETNGAKHWATGEEEGFIYDLPDFRDTENPFENGSYRQAATVANPSQQSVAGWYADIPEDGEYAIYVSYKTLPNSIKDARYTVNYSGGSKEFKVNQTMGGGTWIYLCTVPLEAGYSDTEPVVTLTNYTGGSTETIVTADAVKIGGGMGNIARSPHRSDVYFDPSTPDKSLDEPTEESAEDEETDDEDTDKEDDKEENTETPDPSSSVDESPDGEPAAAPAAKEEPAKTPSGQAPVFRTSGLPRYLEGARYWLHWAGFPEYVYSPYHGSDDYKDDYTSRGHWVNYLAGGSRVLPGREGLNLPVDVAFALHTDAGKRSDDSYVGTLGIYFTQNGASYKDGTPRINSRMLTDVIMQQITKDIRKQWEPKWTRRSMWDKSYVEARVPEVPTTLIELMSHQNFADMQYGLDPEFRFTVSRAIYKGIARFLAERKARELVIQPLPVSDFAIRRVKKNQYRLSWKPTDDPLEPTAKPDMYVIMERSGETMGFHKIAETRNTHFDLKVSDNEIHSFRIIATNAGGAAFPSETLSLRECPDGKEPVLVINGFTRLSGPGSFSSGATAGFSSETDFGVPYIKDISFAGYQSEFRRASGESFGRSGSNYVDKVIAGNTFDYPSIHGASVAHAGRGFVSTSAAAVEDGIIKLSDYNEVDYILGKQKTTLTGRGGKGVRYHVLSTDMQSKLRNFVAKGGDLLISGEYIATDLQDQRSSSEDRKFAKDVLGLAPGSSYEGKSGRLRRADGRNISYSSTLNEKMYIVEYPDVLVPDEDADAVEILTFDNGSRAGQKRKHGRGSVTVMSVPFEAITDASARDYLMKSFLKKK